MKSARLTAAGLPAEAGGTRSCGEPVSAASRAGSLPPDRASLKFKRAAKPAIASAPARIASSHLDPIAAASCGAVALRSTGVSTGHINGMSSCWSGMRAPASLSSMGAGPLGPEAASGRRTSGLVVPAPMVRGTTPALPAPTSNGAIGLAVAAALRLGPRGRLHLGARSQIPALTVGRAIQAEIPVATLRRRSAGLGEAIVGRAFGKARTARQQQGRRQKEDGQHEDICSVWHWCLHPVHAPILQPSNP